MGAQVALACCVCGRSEREDGIAVEVRDMELWQGDGASANVKTPFRVHGSVCEACYVSDAYAIRFRRLDDDDRYYWSVEYGLANPK